MAFFMKLQETYFTKMLDLKHGVPSADTLLRVFALIDSESFMQMFYCWIKDVLSTFQRNSDSEIQRIAIDGKAVRAAAEKGGHIPYIISAYLGNFMRLPCCIFISILQSDFLYAKVKKSIFLYEVYGVIHHLHS